jgi:FlaA1/EpsC-like NDP-sugar epimerase
MMNYIFRYHRFFVIVVQAALVVLANYLAFWLRFDGEIPDPQLGLWAQMLPWLVALRILTFIPFRLHQGLWRYSSIWDLRNIITSVFASTFLFYVLVRWGFALTTYPRSVFVTDSVLLIVFLGGIRLAQRIYRELGRLEREKRILIYGAGDAGEMIVRDTKNNLFYEYEPIGFVDDGPAKVGSRIHGVRVLGTGKQLPQIIAKEEPHEVLVAMPAAEPSMIRGIVKALEPFKIPIKTLPSLRDILGGRVTVNQIRDLSIEDLLERVPVQVDWEPTRRFVRGKRVLVTGAGGSIGSELCRQLADCEPEMLILLDKGESGALRDRLGAPPAVSD